jgi:osmoprotectant transport system permease protein
MRMKAAWHERLPRIDKVGVLVFASIVFALVFEPFVTLRMNRIVSGRDLGLGAVFPHAQAFALYAAGAVSALLALWRTSPAWRLAAGAVWLAGLGVALGCAPACLVSADHPLARVSPATGAWILLFAYAVLAVDASARLKLGPRALAALLAAVVVALSVPLLCGWWDGLSVMREYTVRADSFWQEARRHIALAGGSVVTAFVIGLPLGVTSHRHAGLRGALLPLLSIVETIPSIALFGLLMVPLAMLAAHVPGAAALGIGGIGAAPAFVALVLYALLPVVSSVVTGLEQVPREAAHAAAAMGMTRAQRLWSVELPLALPVLLGGARIVLIQSIGIVTVAALIGGGGFGAFIFQGIGQSATDLVLLGALPTIALAFIAAVVFEIAIGLARGRAGSAVT